MKPNIEKKHFYNAEVQRWENILGLCQKSSNELINHRSEIVSRTTSYFEMHNFNHSDQIISML